MISDTVWNDILLHTCTYLSLPFETDARWPMYPSAVTSWWRHCWSYQAISGQHWCTTEPRSVVRGNDNYKLDHKAVRIYFFVLESQPHGKCVARRHFLSAIFLIRRIRTTSLSEFEHMLEILGFFIFNVLLLWIQIK